MKPLAKSQLDWKVGDPILSPPGDFQTLNPAEMKSGDFYKILIGAVVPRPIAFVSTVNLKGQVNLAPFSFFNAVSSAPPALAFSITYQNDGRPKDTLKNIRETGEFVVNSVNLWMVGAMHQCSAQYPYGVNEMQEVGLSPLPSLKVKAPRVKESAVHFECRLLKQVEVGSPSPGASVIIVGEIVCAHLHSHVYEGGKIDFKKYQAVARLAGIDYAYDFETLGIPRPQLEK